MSMNLKKPKMNLDRRSLTNLCIGQHLINHLNNGLRRLPLRQSLILWHMCPSLSTRFLYRNLSLSKYHSKDDQSLQKSNQNNINGPYTSLLRLTQNLRRNLIPNLRRYPGNKRANLLKSKSDSRS